MNNQMAAEPEKLFPDFWPKAGLICRAHLSELGLDAEDGDLIASDLMARVVHIEPTLPSDPNSAVHRSFGKLMFDATLAELRLFGTDDDYELAGPPHPWRDARMEAYEHPFLIALQQVVAEIEFEANEAEGAVRN